MMLFLLIMNGIAFADTGPDCLDRAELSAVERDFTITSEDAVPNYVHCYRTNQRYVVSKALYDLKKLGRLMRAQPEFDPGHLTENPYEFFRERVREIVLVTAESRSCQAGGSLFRKNEDLRAERKRLYVCPGLTEMKPPDIVRTFIHESRHNDGERYDHVPCETNKKTGEDLRCDPSYEFGGAYGVELELAIRIAFSRELNSVLVNSAKRSAAYTALNKFNARPLGIRDGVVLKTADGEIKFYDGKIVETITSFPESYQTLLTANKLVSVVDSEKARFTNYNHDPERSQVLLHFPALQEADPIERIQFLDFADYRGMFCRLQVRKLVCQDARKAEVKAELALDFIPLSFVRVTEPGFLETGKLYVLSGGGRFHEVPATVAQLREAKRLEEAPGSVTGLGSLGFLPDGRAVGIFEIGLAMIGHPSRGFVKDANLQAWRFAKVNGPYAWSSKLHRITQKSK